MLKCAVTLALVVQITKCRGVWWHQVWVCVISLQLRLLGSTAPTTMWYMASAVGSTVSAQAVGFLSGTFRSSI